MSGIAEIDDSATLKLIADQTHYPAHDRSSRSNTCIWMVRPQCAGVGRVSTPWHGGLTAPGNRGYAPPVSSSAPTSRTRFGWPGHGGDPAGITTAERYRVASLID